MKSQESFGIWAEKRRPRKTQKRNLKANRKGKQFRKKREEQTQEMKENPEQITDRYTDYRTGGFWSCFVGMGCGFGKKERKWERNEVLEDYKRRERERERETAPPTHTSKGIRFFLTPPKSKFVPLITTIHPPSVNMRWETWRKKEKVRERESVLLCVCFSFIFIYKINKLYKYLQKLSYPIPTLQSLIFFHSLFLIFFHGWWLWEAVREREREREGGLLPLP